MKYYVIEEDEICDASKSQFEEKEDTIAVFTTSEWEKQEQLRETYGIWMQDTQVHLCKLENHIGWLHATLRIPQKEENGTNVAFSFYLLPEKLIFVDDGGSVDEQINRIADRKLRAGYTLERFLYDFLIQFLDKDLLLLQNIEKKISKIEEEVLQGQCPDFNMRMLHLKKKISKLYRYYSQLTEVGQELLDNEMDFFSKDDLRMFDRYRDRASRLVAETQILRDYAMQVQDVYQSEIGIRQNEVMRVLTVVTTIFLPLTLIAGWYGMNFAGMPELGWKYGYPVVIAVSIAIVVICLIIFKKKKFW